MSFLSEASVLFPKAKAFWLKGVDLAFLNFSGLKSKTIPLPRSGNTVNYLSFLS